MNLYASKSYLNARLGPAAEALIAAGVTPDQVTLAAIPVAVAGGACLLASPAEPRLLAAVPLLALFRLGLNLIDGNMARRTGSQHPRGELYNEVGDRVADVALLAPVAFLPGAWREVVLLGVLGAVLASYVGISSRAAGSERIYRGILSKPGRMALLSAFSIWVLVAGGGAAAPWTTIAASTAVASLAATAPAISGSLGGAAPAFAGALTGAPPWFWFGPLLLVGTALTFAERVVVAARRLE